MPLKRNDRPAIAGMQRMLLDIGFESVVVRSHDPSRIRRSFEEFRRHRIGAWAHHLHGAVVNAECHTQNFC